MAARHEKTFRRNSENTTMKYVDDVVQNVINQIINGKRVESILTCGQKYSGGLWALLFDSV